MKSVKKTSAKSTASRKPRPAKSSSISGQMVAEPSPHLEVCINEPVTEKSMVDVFERVCSEIRRHQTKRILVDLRQAAVTLSISDLNELAKLVATAFAGSVERLALVPRPQDILAEKFFEPSVTHRGLPTIVTADFEDAVYWLTSKLRRAR